MKKKPRDIRSIEVEGKTVEEAVKKALKELRAERDKVKIEVLSADMMKKQLNFALVG